MKTNEQKPGVEQASDLEAIIDRVGSYLPAQAPIKNFIHLNLLHQFEGYEFFDALDKAAAMFGANSALAETTYQDHYYSGRIDLGDINRALSEQEMDGSKWLLDVSRRKMVRSLLFAAPVPLTAETLRWRLIEKRYLEHFHYEVAPTKISHIRASDSKVPEAKLRHWLDAYSAVVSDWHQEWLHELVDVHDLMHNPQETWTISDSLKLLWIASIVIAHDVLIKRPDFGSNHAVPKRISPIEELVNPYLIKFTSSFLDAGLAHLTIADKSEGLLPAFFAHIRNISLARPGWLWASLKRFEKKSATSIIEGLLRAHNIPQSEWESYLLSKALILKGWGGLVRQSEIGAPGIPARATLKDFLAMRLMLENVAEQHYADSPHLLPDVEDDAEIFELMRPGLADLADEATRIRTTAYHLFHAFQLLPCSGSDLLALTDAERADLVSLICGFDSPERLRVWHKAYEWNLYSRAAKAIVSHNEERPHKKERAPLCQLVCCLDDREESFRRYLEELNDDYETFGTAGFFGVDAEYHSLYEKPAPFCPVNIVPTHKIQVKARKGSEQRLVGLQKIKTMQSDVEMFIENHSRSLIKGWLLALGGITALIPLSLSTLTPRLMHQFRFHLRKRLLNPSDESAILYADDDGHDSVGKYTLDEMANRVYALLTSSGLSRRLAPVVVVMGHGAFSMNNPYRAAYDCAACGGRPGRINPRVFALMANRKDVREKVRTMGTHIPDGTHFIGAFHNTTTDSVEYFDLEAVSVENSKVFDKFRADIETARAQNALERCRRFDDSEIKTVEEAIAHVESRAHHIAQPRPEYGHATNGICFIGRRELTRSLFLDRRAFLVSYDKTIDHDLSSLRSLLRPAIPVCMGINLDYFFSALDNQKYGAGSKLPHNVTSLLGLMTGYCSDLRTGLPSQMVEIHEPVRLLYIIDQEPDLILEALRQEPPLERLVRNRWVVLMSYSAEHNQMHYFNHKGEFEKFDEQMVGLQTVTSSLQWVVGKKGHLEFVRIGH
jgi:uncharacterized protein YbcC (UPF0753/DUF2309 family)